MSSLRSSGASEAEPPVTSVICTSFRSAPRHLHKTPSADHAHLGMLLVLGGGPRVAARAALRRGPRRPLLPARHVAARSVDAQRVAVQAQRLLVALLRRPPCSCSCFHPATYQVRVGCVKHYPAQATGAVMSMQEGACAPGIQLEPFNSDVRPRFDGIRALRC